MQEEAQSTTNDEIDLVCRTFGVGSLEHMQTIKMAARRREGKKIPWDPRWDRYWPSPSERICVPLLDQAVADVVERRAIESKEAIQCIIRRSEILEDLNFVDTQKKWAIAAVQAARMLHGPSSD